LNASALRIHALRISFCNARVAGLCTILPLIVENLRYSGLPLPAYLLLLHLPMLELFSWLLPHAIPASPLAAPARSVERPKPSANAWRRLRTAPSSRSRPVRHLFAIQRLPSGTARYPYNYCYYCVRCRWEFLVDGFGGVVPVDHDRQPLPDAEAAYRRETFARGPCSAHWASSAVIDGGRKVSDQQASSSDRRASLTLVCPRSSAVRAVQ
jgi:hypothetical protein